MNMSIDPTKKDHKFLLLSKKKENLERAKNLKNFSILSLYSSIIAQV